MKRENDHLLRLTVRDESSIRSLEYVKIERIFIQETGY